MPLLLSLIVLVIFDHPYSVFVFMGFMGISNGLTNVLMSSFWAEIYGVNYLGSIKALTGSLMDLTFEAARATSVDEIHQIIRDASTSSLAGILEYNDKPLVSIDFNHCPASSIYDASMTRVVNGTIVKVCSWYDNEWGFSNRMLDTCIALMAAS